MLAAIVESSYDAIIGQAPDGVIRSWNAGAERLYGYSAGEIIGKPITILASPDQPDDIAHVLYRVLAGEAVRHYETRRMRKDGCSIDVSLAMSAIRDSAGRIIGVSTIARDITERKFGEQALIDSIEELRQQRADSSHEQALSAVALSDSEDRLLQQTADSSREQSVSAAALSDSEDRFRQQTADSSLERSISADALSASEGRLRQQIADSSREQAASAVSLSDSEERLRQRASQLEVAFKQLESFSYSVSHDLRAPLRHIQGYGDILMRHAGEQLDEESLRCLNIMISASGEMSKLIDDLLSYSRTGRTGLSRRDISLNELVDEIRAVLAPSFIGRNIHWSIGDLPVVSGEPALVGIVLTNLLDNALKFSRNNIDTNIEVSCQGEENGFAVIRVKDDGAGFDMRYAAKLFGVFQRLHSHDEFDGNGIGLATVRQIINRHGGRTWAEGEVGKGAAFYFTIESSDSGYWEKRRRNGSDV